MARTDDLNVWRIFCEVVQAGGVNAACDVLECEPSTVSRALKAIETEIGAPIFLREGRHLKLTELGARAYDKATKLLNVHELMIQDLKGDQNALSGTIRLASHSGISSIEITPHLIEFRKTYPDITLELHDLTKQILRYIWLRAMGRIAQSMDSLLDILVKCLFSAVHHRSILSGLVHRTIRANA